jgi:predicted DsbA family dithiol-disulfide isomerase
VGIEKLKNQYDLKVRWRAFPLHPETPEEGLTLEELFAGRNIHIPVVLARLKMVADELGLPWGDRMKTYNSRSAQELGKWAEDKGKGDEFHKAVFHAYFAEGRNIAKKDVLSELAGNVGLVKEEAYEILESRSFKAAVDEDWRLSREWGITAVPTFFIHGERLVGAKPYDVLEELVRKHNVPERGSAAISELHS